MDMTPNTNSTHTLDTDSQTPPPTDPTNTSNSKSSSFTNGSLKHHHPTTTPSPPSTVVSYKECLKNHAASIGRHALDGCGEFMPSSSSNPSDPRSLTCAACGCHRNFHRRDNNTQHHHHSNLLTLPLPHRGFSLSTTSPSSLSPSPISSSPSSPPPISHHFPPSYAPNMLFVLGSACSDDHQLQLQQQHQHGSFLTENNNNNNPSGKKRHRTKFSKEQKEKMHGLCEKLGWRMNKEDEGLVQEFCNEVGVPRGVFKVWMHNNKNAFGKRSFRNTSE